MTETSPAGWFAKDPDILRRVGHVLLQVPFAVQRSPRQMILADDCFQLLKIPIDRVSQVVIRATEKLYGSKFFSRQLGLNVHLSSLFFLLLYFSHEIQISFSRANFET